ncbi:hypothetical protein CEXT_813561 [Caerostris extrusa]|uniref:Uncharacterized protein n=1 Tax=Caerostris extrusa TaxID=172846 RepID=A0AAV4MDX1_CAEEX|nr:hypothetical protein CEXT_813561 [Caerostris extrusa]
MLLGIPDIHEDLNVEHISKLSGNLFNSIIVLLLQIIVTLAQTVLAYGNERRKFFQTTTKWVLHLRFYIRRSNLAYLHHQQIPSQNSTPAIPTIAQSFNDKYK